MNRRSVISQTFEIAGQAGYRREAAARDLAAVTANIDEVRRQVRAEVEQRFYRVLVLQRRIETEREALAAVTMPLRRSRKRVAAGEDSRLDGNLATVEAERGHNQLAVLDEQLLQARAELSRCAATAHHCLAGERPANCGQHQPSPPWKRCRLRPVNGPCCVRWNTGNKRPATGWAWNAPPPIPDVTVGLSAGREAPYDAREQFTRLSHLGAVAPVSPQWRRNRQGDNRTDPGRDRTAKQRARCDGPGECPLATLESLQGRVKRLTESVLPALDENRRLSSTAYRAGEIGLLQLLLVNRQLLDARRDYLDALGDFIQTRIALEQTRRLARRSSQPIPREKTNDPHPPDNATLAFAGAGRLRPQRRLRPSTVTEKPAAPQEKTAAGEKAAPTEAPEAGQIHLTEAEIKAAGIRTETPLKRRSTSASPSRPPSRPTRTGWPMLPHGCRAASSASPPNWATGSRRGRSWPAWTASNWAKPIPPISRPTASTELAQADFERAEKLYAEQIVPQKDYLRSRAEQEKARANLRASTDKLRLMGVPPARSETAVSVFPVNAPFAGTVIEKTAVLGELAQPDKSLFTVADLSVVWIEASLFEKDLGKVKTGATVGVTVAAYPDEVFKGRLTYISSVMDKESRTIKARVEVANADGRLKPDMFANAAIDTATAGKALTVPSGAVLLLEGKKAVFVREKEGFEKREVELGRQPRWPFRGQGAASKAGEAVVVEGAYALKARLLKSKIGDHD
jgi:RND family efflux transporter MFP subunit